MRLEIRNLHPSLREETHVFKHKSKCLSNLNFVSKILLWSDKFLICAPDHLKSHRLRISFPYHRHQIYREYRADQIKGKCIRPLQLPRCNKENGLVQIQLLIKSRDVYLSCTQTPFILIRFKIFQCTYK